MTIATLQRHIQDGTLVRHRWTGTDAHGRETACLLAALAPECGAAQSPDACPADVMPPWLAHLTPWIDDAGTMEAWPGHVRRYAALASQWHAWTPEQWGRKHRLIRAACVREAMRHTSTADVLALCEDVAATLERGEWPTKTQRAAASEAAWAAAEAATEAAACAAGRPTAEAAAEAAAWVALAAADEASAAWAARQAAESVEEAAWAARQAAAADRLISHILEILEHDILEQP